MIAVIIAALLSLLCADGYFLNPQSMRKVRNQFLFSTEKYIEATFQNPPFFPGDIEELAQDSSFTVKLALICNFKRVRIDIRMRLYREGRNRHEWLLLTATKMLDDEFSCVKIFFTTDAEMISCRSFWKEMACELNDSTIQQRIKFGSLTDDSSSCDDAQLYFIFNPDNVSSKDGTTILDTIQGICFRAALRNAPVVMIDPILIVSTNSALSLSHLIYACTFP